MRGRESNVWCKAESKGERAMFGVRQREGERAMFGVRRRESNVWCKAESEGERAMFNLVISSVPEGGWIISACDSPIESSKCHC